MLQVLQGRVLDLLEHEKPLWLSGDEQVVILTMLTELSQAIEGLPELKAPKTRANLNELKIQVEWEGSV